MILQELRNVHRWRFNRGHNLHAIASGHNHALRHARQRRQRSRHLGQLVARDGDPLTQLNRRGLVVDADEREGHGAPYLCTWLNWLAAHTASMTRNTAPER